MAKHYNQEIQAEGKGVPSVENRIKRGPISWDYFYTLLGFALTIETGVCSMLPRPHGFVVLLLSAAPTIHLVLFNRWFQQKLIGWKARYEDAER
jgi:hypothetical protein